MNIRKDRKCETIFISVKIEKNSFHLWLDESRWVANVYEVVTIYCKGILFFRWNKIINEETRKKKRSRGIQDSGLIHCQSRSQYKDQGRITSQRMNQNRTIFWDEFFYNSGFVSRVCSLYYTSRRNSEHVSLIISLWIFTAVNSIEIVPRSCCGSGWVLCLLSRIDLGLTALWHAATCPTTP